MRLGILLGGLASFNVLLTFLYQWFIITSLGAGPMCDALFAGMAVPQLVMAVVSGSLTFALVPILANCQGERFQREAWTFFLLAALFFTGIGTILVATAQWWAFLIAPGFTREQAALTASLARIQILGVVFTAQTSVLWSVYHARKRFIWVELSTVFGAAIGLGFLVWAMPRWGIHAAAWALAIRGAMSFLLLLPGLGAFQRPDFKSQALREAWRRLKPLLIGASYYKTDLIVDRIFGSLTPAGGVTLLHLSQQIYSVSTTVIAKAVAQPVFPYLSQQAHLNNFSNFKRLISKRLMAVTAITVVSFVVLLAAGRPILSILFENREFTTENVRTLWWLLIALGGVLVGGSLGQILASGFYAQGDTITPTRIGLVTFTLCLAFKAIGFYWFGLIGLAGSATLFYLLTMVLLLFFLFRKVNNSLSGIT